MLFFHNIRYILLYITVELLKINCVLSIWPSYNCSNIYLLGLFYEKPNWSNTNSIPIQSRAMFKAAVLLSNRYNIKINGNLIEWQSGQTTGNLVDSLSDTCRSVSQSNIVGIIGPHLSREAVIISPVGQSLGIPVIAYSATSPDLSDKIAYPNFYRTVPSDNIAAKALVKLFNIYDWTSCVIIYQNDAFGSGASKTISDAFYISGLTITQTITFDIAKRSFRADLKDILMNSPTRIIIVWAETVYTYIILEEALRSNVVGPHFTWILSSRVSLNSFNIAYKDNLIGMITIEPAVGSVINAPYNMTLLNEAYKIWQEYENETYPEPKIRFIQSNLLLNQLDKTNFLGVSGPIQFGKNQTDRISGSYYSIKNVQSSVYGLNYVSVLEYADPDNFRVPLQENTIVWPGNTLTPPTGRASLKGVTLRVGIIQPVPYTIVQKTTDSNGQTTLEYIGFIPDLIERLKTDIGFNPILQLAPSNQTYDGLVETVNKGINDIAIGDITVNSKRRNLVGFSNAISETSLRLIIRNTPDANLDLFGFLKPFSVNLWLLVLATCISSGILMCIIERKDNENLTDRSVSSQLIMSIWYSFANMVGYGADFSASNAAGRLLTGGLYILSLIIVASYTANLASNLTLAKSQFVLSGIDDLKSGKIQYSRVGVRVGTVGEAYYLSHISHGNKNYYPLTTRQSLYDNLLAGNIDVSFIDDGIGTYVTNNVYCNLTLVGAGFDIGVFGIATPKQWLYAQDLDVTLLLLKETGYLDDLIQKWFAVRKCPDSQTTTSNAMGVEAVGGLYIIYAVIYILSIVLFLWIKRLSVKNILFKSKLRKKFQHKRKYSTRTNSEKNSQ
ncbi:unnamed protein product [Rotaria sordida]|uniref:Ionotropic glutamate receptor C-terminal domain-containing protein n=1 Tax=Rotaria sordida TaxID=392033 RepID=A0A815PYX2_9BILA|nr:unnamed protein product [Rotaria sordida]